MRSLRYLSAVRGTRFVACIVICLVSGVFPAAASPGDGDRVLSRLKVAAVSFVPESNYQLARDAADIEQLTDGETVADPLWTKAGSVGWASRTPVQIIMRPQWSGEDTHGFRLRVHAGIGPHAGVFGPRRIDVYCDRNGAWWHSGASTFRNADEDRTSSRWFDVDIQGSCQQDVAAVIHANGAYLMIDEIVIEKHPSGTVLVPSPDASAVASPVAGEDLRRNSSRRLRAALSRERQAASESYIRGFGNGTRVWVDAPWTDLGSHDIASLPVGKSNLQIGSLQSWPVSYVVGVMNTTATEQVYQLAVRAPAGVTTVIEALQPVLAADGSEVHDAIVPLPPGGLLVPGRSIRYFFLTHDVPVGNVDIHLAVSGIAGDEQTAKVSVESISSSNVSGEAPKVLTWGYSVDIPIWNVSDKSSLVRSLVDDGVNVFVVHPLFIPVPSVQGDWERKEKRFVDELRLYRSAKTALLYLGWDSRYGGSNRDAESISAEVVAWTRRLSAVMEREGYSHDEWAIYPFDEPDSHELALLDVIGKAILSVDDDIRIYANPGRMSLTDILPGGPVWNLRDVVSIWQPQLGIASKVMSSGAMLIAPSSLWLYQTGAAPAKSITPGCYKKLGLEAASIGATGIGVWSFSSTNGDSAWDDFDGNGPDWAMVYEGKDVFVRSRRWEAFKSGIRDLRVLSSCRRNSERGSSRTTDCAWLSSSLERELNSLSCYEVR
jgi:hypothetical protein